MPLSIAHQHPCAEGIVFREATGIEDEKLRGYGDPSSNTEPMALERAAPKFRLGLSYTRSEYDRNRKTLPLLEEPHSARLVFCR